MHYMMNSSALERPRALDKSVLAHFWILPSLGFCKQKCTKNYIFWEKKSKNGSTLNRNKFISEKIQRGM